MHNEAKKNIKISKKSLLISIISILAVFVVGTFAWFTWRSNETALVLTVGDIKNLNITLAPYKFNSSIVPSSSYNTNDYVQVKASNNSEELSYSMGLFYRINSIDEELVSSDFQYTVEKSTDGNTYTSYKTGDFSTAQSGVDYPILTAEELSADTTSYYRVYIWIESNGDQSSMQGKIFDAELRASYISDSSSRPNAPVLDNNGMVPVTIANDGTVTTVSKNSSNWYNYDNKKWANAVLVKETGTKTRSYYLNNPNQTVNQDDILAYYVWIPRYKYRISAGTCASVSNPTISSHPECYDLPYQMSDTNKSILIDAIYNYLNFIGENISKSDVTTAVNDGLTTGTFTLTGDGLTDSFPILDLFSPDADSGFYASNGYEYEFTNSDDVVKLAMALYESVINDPDTDFEYSVDIAYEDIEFSRHLGVIYILKSIPIMGFEEALATYEEMTGEKIGYTKTPNISGTFKPNNVIESNKEKEIDIVFETASTDKSRGDATSTYYTHPAFTFGNDELSGIWVGKFETSASPDSNCFQSPSDDNCRNNNIEPRILPKVNALNYQYIGNQFMTALKFSGGSMNTSSGIVTFGGSTTFGLSDTTNSHMMKNSEWGAVAYLSHSKYGTCTNGTCTEIRINNYWSSPKSETGCGAATSTTTGKVSTCAIRYGESTSYPQSTTGNISGVFDMSGGLSEYVMGNYNNTTNLTYFPKLPESKYYDAYLSSTFNGNYSTNMSKCTLPTCGGHALFETASWYSDYAYFVLSHVPWFMRGGFYSDGTSAGAFYSNSYAGDANIDYGFRSVLVAE